MLTLQKLICQNLVLQRASFFSVILMCVWCCTSSLKIHFWCFLLHLSFVRRNYVDDLSCKYLCTGITYAKLIFGKLNLLYIEFFIKMFKLFLCNWPYFRILSLNFISKSIFLGAKCFSRLFYPILYTQILS